MKKILFLLFAGALFSCSSPKKKVIEVNETNETRTTSAEEYINTITGFTCEKATITDNGYLIIAIDATSDEGYDNLASQFLDEAKREGVTGLKGCAIVDIKNAKFEQGAVVGKRIGKAYD